MPIACDPTQSVWFSLDSDKPKPEPSRPQFQARFLTCRQTRQVGELVQEAAKLSDVEAEGKLLDAIMIGVIGWRNMPHGKPFSRDAIADTLTVAELYELAFKQSSETRLAEIDRKKSALPSASATA